MPDISRQTWLERIACELVPNDAGRPVSPDQPFAPHTKLHYYQHIANEPVLPAQASIVSDDAHLLVADKPHFMSVPPSGPCVQQCLLVKFKRLTGHADLVPLHRIDRETTGLVLFGKRLHERDAYHALFRDHQIHKRYHAVAAHCTNLALPSVHTSHLAEDPAHFFKMREVPGEANSETGVAVLHQEGQRALYQLEPVTGKRHQLRVHMNALGIPIEGDQFYPHVLRGPDEAEDFKRPLQLLAQAVAFAAPLTGKHRKFESRLQLSMTHKL